MKHTALTHALLAHAGSLRTTLVAMGLLGTVVLAGQVDAFPLALGLAVAMAILAANLLAALFVHPGFRRQLPLLVFHLALLALLVLVALGRLTALDGRFELTQGVAFDGTLLESRSGRWHGGALSQLRLAHDGFEIDYAAGRKRGATRNQVRWQLPDGTSGSAVIGDHRPLVLEGYRFYTSPNKGFAPLLVWSPARGTPVSGAVHLPSYPANELRQSREWLLPDGRAVWVLLQIDENLIDPAGPASFRMPAAHRVVVRIGDQRAELAPGEQLAIDGGTLAYAGLRTWMGYRVTYDPTLAWLLAAALVACLALAWHYTDRFFAGRRAAEPAGVPLQGAADV